MSGSTETVREVAAEIVHEFDDDGRIVGAGMLSIGTLLGKVLAALAGLHSHADKREIAATVQSAVAEHEADVKQQAADAAAQAKLAPDGRQVGVGGAIWVAPAAALNPFQQPAASAANTATGLSPMQQNQEALEKAKREASAKQMEADAKKPPPSAA